jgi:hypothetical protein
MPWQMRYLAEHHALQAELHRHITLTNSMKQ